MDLFAADPPAAAPVSAGATPLAERLRPRTLADVVGQEHLTGPAGAIGRMVAAGKLASLVLWGPPGTGKTTIARLLADAVGMRFVGISAVFAGVADLKKLFAEAKTAARAGQQTLLFVDEIHRFNRAQQDGFLPFVEKGTVVARRRDDRKSEFRAERGVAQPRTSAHPPPPRCAGLALDTLLDRAPKRSTGRGPSPSPPDARSALVASADGDGRFLLNQAETLFDRSHARPSHSTPARPLRDFLQRRVAVYDKDRDGHYNLISALHKALRGSDPRGLALLSRRGC